MNQGNEGAQSGSGEAHARPDQLLTRSVGERAPGQPQGCLVNTESRRADLTPNLAEAQCFLELLDPAGVLTFQAFPEAKSSTARATVLHGTLAEHGAQLEALNRAGAGIFVMVNAGDGEIKPGARTCRTEANVIRVRALFVDLDGAPLEPVLAFEEPPDLVVETSPGRWHAYWLVDDVELQEFSSFQKDMATHLGGDPAVCDLPRVMRLPGFWHLKSETPFLSHLIDTAILSMEPACGS